jgi:hypothetical protein
VHEEEGKGEPIYLEFVDALELYAAIIGAAPAQAAAQLRDQGALEGALTPDLARRNFCGETLFAVRSRSAASCTP